MDEIGYLPFTVDGAHAFFQLISRFYETRSIIFTSKSPTASGVRYSMIM
ncbi:MAG: ATP-binding protein [Methanotrichaceae archaeon]